MWKPMPVRHRKFFLLQGMNSHGHMYCNQMVHAEGLRFPRGGPRGFTKTYAF